MSEREVSTVEVVACLRRLAGAARRAEGLLRRMGVELAGGDGVKGGKVEVSKAGSRQGVPNAR